MSYIGQTLPIDRFAGYVTDSFTGDGSTTAFTIDAAVASGDVIYATHTAGVLPVADASSLASNILTQQTDIGANIVDADLFLIDDGAGGTLRKTAASRLKTYIGGSDPASADGDSLGTASLEWSDLYLADGGIVYFGNDQDVKLTHDADKGLILKHAATADDKPVSLTLQTGETDMAANDVIGKLQFQAPDEGTGTDAVLVSAAIQAVAEGDHSSSSNATRLEFLTGASEAAAKKWSITSAGILTAESGSKLSMDGLSTSVAAGDISFFAATTGNLAVANTTWTKITAAEQWDRGGNYGSDKFTAPKAGVYKFTAMLRLPAFSGNRVIMVAYKNGATVGGYAYGTTTEIHSENTTYHSVTNTQFLSLAADDYIEFYLYQDSGASVNVFERTFYGYRLGTYN